MQRPASPLPHVAPADMPEDLRKLHAASTEVVGEAERIEVFAAHPDLCRWYQQNFYRTLFENGDGTMAQNLDGALTPDLHERLAQHFTAAEILELGVIAAMLTGWTKLMFTFDLVTREDNCPVRVAAPR